MGKFEIINNEWIRVPTKQNESATCRIASIHRIDFSSVGSEYSGMKYAISLFSGGDQPILIWYGSSEYELAKTDFAYIEKLLF